MANFQTPISNQVKRLTPQQFEAASRHHSEQSEVKRIFRSMQFQAERSVEQNSSLESRIRRLNRRNNQLRHELHEQRAAGAGGAQTKQQEIIAQLQSKDEELGKLRAEQEKIAEEKMEWEKELEVVEKLKLVSGRDVVGMESTWEEAAALLKRIANGIGSIGDDAVKVFGADSMMMGIEPFLDSLKAIEGRFEKMDLQRKAMRQAIELLGGKLADDGFVDVGDLLEVEKALENGFDGE